MNCEVVCKGACATTSGKLGLLFRFLSAVAAILGSDGVAYLELSEPMCERRDAQSSPDVKRRRHRFERPRFLSRLRRHRCCRCSRHFRHRFLSWLFSIGHRGGARGCTSPIGLVRDEKGDRERQRRVQYISSSIPLSSSPFIGLFLSLSEPPPPWAFLSFSISILVYIHSLSTPSSLAVAAVLSIGGSRAPWMRRKTYLLSALYRRSLVAWGTYGHEKEREWPWPRTWSAMNQQQGKLYNT